MTAGAHFHVNQAANPIPTGTQDVTRLDVWQSQPIHLIGDSSSGQGSPAFTILAYPSGSARTAATNAGTFDATYTPDVPGSYRVEFLVGDGAGANRIVRVFRVTRNNAGLVIDDGFCEPAFGEESGDDNASGNDRGYAKTFEVGAKKGSITVATFTALRGIVSSRFSRCRVSDPVRGGEFVWKTGAPPADDDGINIVPTGSSNGWWKRQYAGRAHRTWFGDGETVPEWESISGTIDTTDSSDSTQELFTLDITGVASAWIRGHVIGAGTDPFAYAIDVGATAKASTVTYTGNGNSGVSGMRCHIAHDVDGVFSLTVNGDGATVAWKYTLEWLRVEQ